jgi:penicillin amidase
MGRRITSLGLIVFVAATTLAVPAQGQAGVAAAATAPTPKCTGEHVGHGIQSALICRDRYGVPSIWADAMPGVWFGTGWAQGEDRLAQLELARRNARGTLSQLFGSIAPTTITSDKQVLTTGYSDRELHEQFDSLPAWIKSAATNFVDGINSYVDYIYSTPALEAKDVPFEFYVIGKLMHEPVYRPAPYTDLDVMAQGDYLARQFGTGGGSELSNLAFLQYLEGHYGKKQGYAIFNDALWINDPNAPTTVPDGRPRYGRAGSSKNPVPKTPASLVDQVRHDPSPSVVASAATALARRKTLPEAIGTTFHIAWRDGSDAWVVSPKKTTTGSTFLWGGPQEGFGSPSVDWEVYQHGPGYDVGGMTIALDPIVLIGHNANIAFTTTSEETIDEQVYQEKVNFKANPPDYYFDGHWHPMQVFHHVLDVPGKAPQPWVSYRTVHGPVIKLDPKESIAYSVRYASFNKEWETFEGFALQTTAQSLAQYRTAISKVATLHNFFYADRKGNIAYFGAGLVPKLKPCPGLNTGPKACDPRLPHPGTGSEEWQGFVPFSQMPHSVNPPQGFLLNWNTKPSTQAYYQQNGWDEYWGTIYRSETIAKAIEAKGKLSPAQLTAIEADIGTIDTLNVRPTASFFLPKLFAAYAASPGLQTPAGNEAIATLKAWNGVDTVGSVAMSIYVQWEAALQNRVFGPQGTVPFVGSATNQNFSHLGTYNLLWHVLGHTKGIVPCTTLCSTVDWLGQDPDATLVGSLDDALSALSGTGTLADTFGAAGFGTTDQSKWGWVPTENQNWGDLDAVASAGVSLGLLPQPNLGTSPTQNRSTWMQAITLGKKGVRGEDVLVPGESGFISKTGAFSPHFNDQVNLFNDFAYKPMQNLSG